MSIKPGKDAEALLAQLERLAEALGRTSLTPGLPRPRALLPGEPSASKALAMGGLGAALVVLGAGIVSGMPALIVLGALLCAVAGVFLVDGMTELVRASLPAGVGARDPSRPHIGMGATVAQGARIEPGATVEMGATVREGARPRATSSASARTRPWRSRGSSGGRVRGMPS